MLCPQCNYQRQSHDRGIHPGVCPVCGVAYAKWDPDDDAESTDSHSVGPTQNPALPWRQRWRFRLLFVPSDRHESAFWGHLLIWFVFLLWGLAFIFHGLDWAWIGASFLHGVNLPFHEYGHIMFSPFGTFMMYLGGSLLQILLPLALLGFFSVWQQDNFAASIMLWWCGQNFIDISPYIADAPTRYLPLVGNAGPQEHDWWNLLQMAGGLESAQALSWLVFLIGVAIILLANIWGAMLLYIELQGRGVLGHQKSEPGDSQGE